MISENARYQFNNMNPVSKLYGLGDALSGMNLSRGNVYHVDSANGIDLPSRDGLVWGSAFKTITYALTIASDFDTILLAPTSMRESTGETFPLQITQEGLKIYGCNYSMNQNKCLINNQSTVEAVFEILENNVEIRNVAITQQAAADVILLGSATVSAVYKFAISGVRIDGYSAGKHGIASYGTTDCPDIHIEKCLFRGLTDHAIDANWTRAMINDCIIYTVAAKAGINHVPNAGDRPSSVYARNRIIGVNSTDTGILLTGTPSAGLLAAYDNYILNCATTITQATTNVAVQFNYVNDGAGGALIDPIA